MKFKHIDTICQQANPGLDLAFLEGIAPTRKNTVEVDNMSDADLINSKINTIMDEERIGNSAD